LDMEVDGLKVGAGSVGGQCSSAVVSLVAGGRGLVLARACLWTWALVTSGIIKLLTVAVPGMLRGVRSLQCLILNGGAQDARSVKVGGKSFNLPE
jgi:hypothetical protein